MLRREGFLLALAALLLAALYAFLPSPLFYEDASGFVPELYAEKFSNPHVTRHLLILPLGRAIQRSTGLPPEDALGLLSALSGAAIPILVYIGLRRFGFGAAPALFGSALLGLAPGVVFYGRHIEVHAPNAAAAAGAFALACGGGRRTGGLAPFATVPATMGAVAATHAGGILSCPFLSLLGAARSRGTRRAAFLLVAIPTGLACVAGGLALVAFQAGWLPKPRPEDAFYSITVAFEAPWHFGPLSILRYASRTVVPGAAVLLPVGLVGLGLLLRSNPKAALLLAAWFLAYLYSFGAWGFEKIGGYVLPTYPALAVGAAEAFRRLGERGRKPMLFLAAPLLAAQAFVGARMALSDMDEPHPLAWARSLRAATNDSGALVTDWLAHRTLARLHTKVIPLSVGPLNFFAPEKRPEAISLFADFLEKEIEGGRAIYLDASLEDWAKEAPDLVPLLETLRRRFAQEPVGDGTFRGWRLRKPRP